MKIFTVTGPSDSGKTTTIEVIIKTLIKRGYSVASVKEIHYEAFAIDEVGSNTDRHKKAGSQLVTALGHYETDVLFQRKLTLKEIVAIYKDEFDYLVLEGMFDGSVPMLVTEKSLGGLESRMNPWVFGISGKVSTQNKHYEGRLCIDALEDPEGLVDLIEQKVYERLPFFPEACCSACGYTCATLGMAILKGEANRKLCKGKEGVSLKINGQPIEMVPFVEQLLKNAVLGVVSELDGYDLDGKIEIEL